MRWTTGGRWRRESRTMDPPYYTYAVGSGARNPLRVTATLTAYPMRKTAMSRQLILSALAGLALAIHAPTIRAQDSQTHAARHGEHTQVGWVPGEVLERPVTLRSGVGRLHDPVTTSSSDAQAFYDQAMAYLHSYVWIEAVRSFQQALRHDPDLALAHVGLSRAYGSMFDPAAAAAALARAQALRDRVSPREQRRIDLRAKQMEAMSDPADAAKFRAYKQTLDEALNLDPDDPELWLLRGNAEEPDATGWGGQLGTSASIAFYEAALARAPDHFAAHHYMVHSYEGIRRFDRAVQHGEIYARLVPGVPHAQHMLAHDLMKVGRVADAVRQFALADSLEHAYYQSENIARDLDWHHPHNQMLLALSYQHQGRYQDAEKVLRRVEGMTPVMEMLEAWYRKDLPELLLGRGRAQEARAAGETLIRMKTPMAHAAGHAIVARTLLAQNRTAEAEPHVKAAEQAAQQVPPVLPGGAEILARVEALRGEYLLRSGARTEGAQVLREALRKSRAATGPDEWIEGLFRIESIARSAREAEEWTLAGEAAQRLLEHDPAYAGGHYATALVAEQRGDVATARREYAEAVRLWASADPELPELRQARTKLVH